MTIDVAGLKIHNKKNEIVIIHIESFKNNVGCSF